MAATARRGANANLNANANTHTAREANGNASAVTPIEGPIADRTVHWDHVPRALANDARLRVVSLAAGRAGVRAGMTIAEARARCAELDVRPWDDVAIADAILAATTALLAASPQVTPVAGSPGMWWVGANGFDAIGGEAQLAATLLTIAQQWHPDARVAIASSCVAARAATWAPNRSSTANGSGGSTANRSGGSTTNHSGGLTTNRSGGSTTNHSGGLTTHRSGGTTATDSDLHITIVPPGQCATYLAPAPLGLVPMDDDLREALQALGLRTIGALASLAPGEIEQRWGPEGLMAWRLARGDDPRRPGLVRVEAARSASVELPDAVESAEPILFVLRAQLQRLLHECVHDGRAAAAVAVTLVLDAGRQYPIEEIGSEMAGHVHVPETSDDSASPVGQNDKSTGSGTSGSRTPGSETPSCSLTSHPRCSSSSLLGIPQRTITREVRPARPLARLEPLFDQCRALLERWRIPAPIIGVTVSIPATAPLSADQGDLLVPSWRDAAMNAEAVFARLRAALDPEHRGDVVVHPEARDTHRIEESGAWVPADAITLAAAPLPTSPQSASPQSASLQPPPASAVLRLLGAPESVEIEAPHGIPDAVWWRGRRIAFASAHGPERLSGDWWRGDGYARDYWRCLAEEDGELLLYHAGTQWYVQGWYD